MQERVLITGGGGGLGGALAREYLARGARVAVADLPQQLDAVDPGMSRFACDVRDGAAVAALVDAVEGELGPLTGVVANAGVPGGGGIDAPDEVWALAWEVNVMAHVHLARAVVPRMLARGGGQFVSVASAAGLLTNLGNAPYTTTKHAAVAFAEWLAITHGDDGLDVRLVAPMGIETPMLQAGQGTLAGESVRALGVIDAAEAARRVLDGLHGEEFLVLTHPETAQFEAARTSDRDTWLVGMRRAQAALVRQLFR